jgi:hypothetical protein
MFREYQVFAVAVDYTLLDVFTSSGLTGSISGLNTLLIPSPSPACQAVLSFALVVEYTLLVVFPTLRVDSDDKPTAYAADSLAVTRVSAGP